MTTTSDSISEKYKQIGSEESSDPSPKVAKSEYLKRQLTVNPKKLIFYTVFLLVYCFSGLIVMLDIIPYRMAAASLLVIPFLFLYRFRFDRVSVAFILLISVVILSGIVNQATIGQIVISAGIIILVFLGYYLVKIFIDRENAAKVIRICVLVGMIQLPAIVFQIMTYDLLPARLKSIVIRIDYDFGTFNFKTDAAMAFFLLALIIFLLFDEERNYIIKMKWFVVAWLSLTILVVNSEMMKLALAVVWGIYVIRFLSFTKLVRIGILLALLASALWFSGVLDETIDDFFETISKATNLEEEQMERFLSGGYGRRAAFAYYLNTELKLIGDGPGRYFSPLEKERKLGNTGHLFSYYAEIGLLGWMVSAIIFFLIAFPGKRTRFRLTMIGFVIFLSLQLLSLTTLVMNNISIIIIYTIVSLSYLVPKRSEIDEMADSAAA